MSKPLLSIIVGLPRTGKSTAARQMAEETGAVLLTADKFRNALGVARWSKVLEPVVRNTIAITATALLLDGQSVIIDDCNHQRCLRAPYLEIVADGIANGEIVQIRNTTKDDNAWKAICRRTGFPWWVVAQLRREREDVSSEEAAIAPWRMV